MRLIFTLNYNVATLLHGSVRTFTSTTLKSLQRKTLGFAYQKHTTKGGKQNVLLLLIDWHSTQQRGKHSNLSNKDTLHERVRIYCAALTEA